MFLQVLVSGLTGNCRSFSSCRFSECFVFNGNLTRTFFEDRDLEPTDTITFNFLFKTLGPIRADVF